MTAKERALHDFELMRSPARWPGAEHRYLCLKRWLPGPRTFEFATLYYHPAEQRARFRCVFEDKRPGAQLDVAATLSGDEGMLKVLIFKGWLVD